MVRSRAGLNAPFGARYFVTEVLTPGDFSVFIVKMHLIALGAS